MWPKPLSSGRFDIHYFCPSGDDILIVRYRGLKVRVQVLHRQMQPQKYMRISVVCPAGSLWAAGRNWLWSIWRRQTRICSEPVRLVSLILFLFETFSTAILSYYGKDCMYFHYNMWLLDYLFRTCEHIIRLILALKSPPVCSERVAFMGKR